MDTTRSEIEALVDSRSEAIRAKDLERLLSFYSPGIVYFDVVPPLQYVGIDALRGRFSHWFGGFEGPIGQDVHELTVVGSGDVAVVHVLIRSGGKLTNGPEVERWVRATSVCERADGGWLVVHEHVSLPVDLVSGRVAVDLAP